MQGDVMEISGYVIDIESTAASVKQKGYKTIILQIPEGLKRSVIPIVDFLKKETGAHVLVAADPCFGACDLLCYDLLSLKVDCIIHIGHTAIPTIHNAQIPTIFVNAQSTLDVSKVVEKALPFLDGKNIGVVTTAQHLHTITEVKRILQKHNRKPFIVKGDERIFGDGQILGCNFSSAAKIAKKVDCFLFVGSGTFHPVGLLLSTKKPVIAADPYTTTVKKQEIEDMKNNILRQRYGAIMASRTARQYGILIGVKQGQQRTILAYQVQEMLDSAGKQSVLITLSEFSPMSLQGFDVDCYVSTACPRIAIDDYLQYKKPIITPVELEIVLGKREWETYVFDELLA
jgi:2-(3-amino-3-carboxypropyl)histidine synthase